MLAGALSRTGAIQGLLLRPTPPVPRGRLIRLAVTATVALAVIWWLAVATLEAHPLILGGLASTWLLMPVALLLATRDWRMRPWLVVPSAIETLSLVAIDLTVLPDEVLAAAGWLVLTAGIILGGLLGAWLWMGWAPVPHSLRAPYARLRWALIASHVGLVIGGLVLVAGAHA